MKSKVAVRDKKWYNYAVENDGKIVKNSAPRVPKKSSPTAVTNRPLSSILPGVLQKLSERVKDRPDLILKAWPEIIGPQLAAMTEAVSFIDGVLLVKVKNSTLYSILHQHDRGRILTALRQRFPSTKIYNVLFRIG